MLASVKGKHIHPLYIFPFFMHIFPHPPLLCLIIGILMWHSPYMILFQASTWILLLILFILAFSVGFDCYFSMEGKPFEFDRNCCFCCINESISN